MGDLAELKSLADGSRSFADYAYWRQIRLMVWAAHFSGASDNTLADYAAFDGTDVGAFGPGYDGPWRRPIDELGAIEALRYNFRGNCFCHAFGNTPFYVEQDAGDVLPYEYVNGSPACDNHVNIFGAATLPAYVDVDVTGALPDGHDESEAHVNVFAAAGLPACATSGASGWWTHHADSVGGACTDEIGVRLALWRDYWADFLPIGRLLWLKKFVVGYVATQTDVVGGDNHDEADKTAWSGPSGGARAWAFGDVPSGSTPSYSGDDGPGRLGEATKTGSDYDVHVAVIREVRTNAPISAASLRGSHALRRRSRSAWMPSPDETFGWTGTLFAAGDCGAGIHRVRPGSLFIHSRAVNYEGTEVDIWAYDKPDPDYLHEGETEPYRGIIYGGMTGWVNYETGDAEITASPGLVATGDAVYVDYDYVVDLAVKRLLFYVWLRTSIAHGVYPDPDANCTFADTPMDLEVTGDNGASWVHVGSLTLPAHTECYTCFKFEVGSGDLDLSSILTDEFGARLIYTGDENADAGSWPAPTGTGEDSSWYIECADSPQVIMFVEFDLPADPNDEGVTFWDTSFFDTPFFQ